MYASIDKAIDKIARQLRRYKERLQDHKGRLVSVTEATEVMEETVPKIVKRKRFPILRLAPGEAAMQMDLLDKGFFIFLNPATEKINLVYRRKDGSVGLIDPVY